jgi:lipoprotein-releasing system permease protein
VLASLQTNFIKRVLTSQPHIQIIPPDEVSRPLRVSEVGVMQAPTVQQPTQRLRSIDQWQHIVLELSKRADITNITPTVSAAALAVRGDATRSISMTGIDPAVYFNIVRIPDYMVLGQTTLTSEQIIIGTELAKDLGVTIGDKLNVTAANLTARALTVSGIFDLGNKGVNQRTTFVALRTAQSLANLSGGVTTIDITVADMYAAEAIARVVSASTGMEADSWIKTNAQLFSALSTQAMSFTTIEVFVALSVAFGIASVLSVSVIQRSKDIGILRAMGASQQQMLRVFLLQGGLLGIVGAVVGSALGGGGLSLFHTLVRTADGSEVFPLELQPSIFVAAIALAGITGVLAAALPALNAARLDPVVAIRG